MDPRGSAALALTSIGVIAFSLAAVSSVARRSVFDPAVFEARIGASLEDPRVTLYVGDRIAEAIVQEKRDLTAFRPLIAGAAREVVSTSGFRAVARGAARSLHAALFSKAGQDLIVSVPDVGVLVRSALARANPALAEKIPVRAQSVIASLGSSHLDRLVLRLARLAQASQRLTRGLALAGVLLVVGGLALARSTRHAVGRLGWLLLGASATLLLLRPAGRAFVATLPEAELARHAAAGLWDAFTAPLRTWAFVLGGVGLVFEAASRSLIARFEPRKSGARLVAWLENPGGGARGHVLRAALLIVAGALAVWKPAHATSLITTLLGGLLAFAGLRELFEMLVGAPSDVDAGAAARRSRFGRVLVLVPACALVAAIVWLGSPRSPRKALPTEGCNGAVELCGRALDRVVFPTTHNAMSAADIPEWLFPQQERGISGQLADGVRGLLLDVHYGIPVEDRIKTDLDSERGSREKLEKAVGVEGYAAAMRIRARLVGKDEGPRGLYLCHGFCELGATALPEALTHVHEFLATNPDEVLVLVIEDYVAPEDLAAAFAGSGLDGLVYRGPTGSPWPTLQEMVDRRERVVVLTESGQPGVPWIHPAFEVLQETPYHFEHPSELSCAANRGGSAGSLFLMNNWIDTTPAPKPSNAALVNAYDALLARSRECEKERGRQPTLLAVDFYRTGDLFRVARTLNGLD